MRYCDRCALVLSLCVTFILHFIVHVLCLSSKLTCVQWNEKRENAKMLKGAKKFVIGAKFAINDVVTNLETHEVVHCIIPHKHHGRLIGANGVHVRELMRNHNVPIQLPHHPGKSVQMRKGNGGDDVIVITGKRYNFLRVKEALLDLVPCDITVEKVPFRLHRAIIGEGGENVRYLCDEYGVSITFSLLN